MPAYDAAADSVDKPVLTAGRPLTLWTAASINASPPDPAESQQFCFHRDPNFPNCCSVEVKFSGDPGAFQLDVQVADTDEDAYYVTKSSLTSGLNSDFVGRVEITNLVAKFGRLNMVSLGNSVSYTAKVS